MKFAIRKREDQEAIIQAASQLSDYHWAVCVVLLDTGCHPSNVYDVRDEGDVASWTRVKTGATCWASMNDRLSEAIGMVHRRGRLSRQTTYNKVREASKAWGWEKGCSPQSLRKSYCLNRLREGYNDRVVGMMMGCGVRLVDTVYSQLSPEELKRIAQERVV